MKQSILILDDEETLTWAMAQTLAEEGLKVHLASEAPEALKLLSSDPAIAVAILEPGLPGHDGFELIQTIQRHYPGVKFIVMSAYFDSDTEDQLDQLGCKLRLEKPFCLCEMLKFVHEALSGSASSSTVYH